LNKAQFVASKSRTDHGFCRNSEQLAQTAKNLEAHIASNFHHPTAIVSNFMTRNNLVLKMKPENCLFSIAK